VSNKIMAKKLEAPVEFRLLTVATASGGLRRVSPTGKVDLGERFASRSPGRGAAAEEGRIVESI